MTVVSYVEISVPGGGQGPVVVAVLRSGDYCQLSFLSVTSSHKDLGG